MKAISVKDFGTDDTNYASLIEKGIKSIETRTWLTKYRGDILICCSKSSKSQNKGLAVCVVELTDIKEMTTDDESKACCKVYDRAKSWILKNHRTLSEKFPVKGKLSIYEVEIPDGIEFIKTNKF